MSKYITKNPKNTIAVGRRIAAGLSGGDIVLLYGELGAGKTTLVKGIAEGLGVKEDIVSPTFTLMNVYNVRNTKTTKLRNLVHIDTYRLKNERELIDVGVEDYLENPETVCVIEWPEKLSSILKNKKMVSVTILHGKDDNKREITVLRPRDIHPDASSTTSPQPPDPSRTRAT